MQTVFSAALQQTGFAGGEFYRHRVILVDRQRFAGGEIVKLFARSRSDDIGVAFHAVHGDEIIPPVNEHISGNFVETVNPGIVRDLRQKFRRKR